MFGETMEATRTFASQFFGIGLFLAGVFLAGCNGLAAPGKPATTSPANSPRITMAATSVGAVQSGSARAAIETIEPSNGQVVAAARASLGTRKPASLPAMATRPAPLQITTEELPAGTAQNDYDTRLIASGGVPPYYWDATAGQIAPGLTLRSSVGTISGIPFAPGVFSFTVRVRDSRGSSLSTTVSQNILAATPSAVSDVLAKTDSTDGGPVAMISDR